MTFGVGRRAGGCGGGGAVAPVFVMRPEAEKIKIFT